MEVWPELWPAWSLFVQMSGQWRCNFRGAYALDYTALFARMDRMRLDDVTWEQMFSDVRVLEAEALSKLKARKA